MITFIGKEYDYAIMKQVQQLKLAEPSMAVVALDDKTNFSRLVKGETLYLVSHGDSGTGEIRGVDRAVLLGWLKDQDRGVPAEFGGIVILSCYSGLQKKPPEPSLTAYLAQGLASRTKGTTVAGANGYSYGTPEFRKTKRSSVLPMKLSNFYSVAPSAVDVMTYQWLEHKPTHAGGVLKDGLNITVDQAKTIRENLDPIQGPQKTSDIANEYVAKFVKPAEVIEEELTSIIGDKIPGDSVAERTDYLVGHDSDPEVKNWNAAIERQYKLFCDFYLWAPAADAFSVETVQ